MEEKIVYHIARTRDELEQAFSLVYKEYAFKGYIPSGYKSKMRISLYNALPSTTSFVAKRGKTVLATVTLIPDSPMGIPMDKIYSKELLSFRNRKLRIAEVSQLSIDSSIYPKGWFSMFNFSKLIFVFKLFKLVFDYSRLVDKIDELCIAVNPKHQYLYKFIFFEIFGKLKYYGSVNKAPALALHLSINKGLEEKSKRRIGVNKIFYGSTTSPEVFKGKFIFKKSDLEYFFIKKSNLFKQAEQKQLNYLRKCYGRAI